MFRSTQRLMGTKVLYLSKYQKYMEENIALQELDQRMQASLVVNYFSGPGAGKSTMCAAVFAALKWRGVNCEIAPEYAKGIVWEGSLNKLKNQNYIFGKQHQAVFRLCGAVDVILTDSPIILSAVYDPRKDPLFRQFAIQEFNRFNNLNFYISRTKKYMAKGRTQTELEAKAVDDVVMSMLVDGGIPFQPIAGEKDSVELVAQAIMEHIGHA